MANAESRALQRRYEADITELGCLFYSEGESWWWRVAYCSDGK